MTTAYGLGADTTLGVRARPLSAISGLRGHIKILFSNVSRAGRIVIFLEIPGRRLILDLSGTSPADHPLPQGLDDGGSADQWPRQCPPIHFHQYDHRDPLRIGRVLLFRTAHVDFSASAFRPTAASTRMVGEPPSDIIRSAQAGLANQFRSVSRGTGHDMASPGARAAR